jgi:low affinity Fe/Cu permease
MPKTSWFTRFAKRTAHFAGRPAAFGLAAGTMVVWGLSGPLFGFGDNWHAVIDTGSPESD